MVAAVLKLRLRPGGVALIALAIRDEVSPCMRKLKADAPHGAAAHHDAPAPDHIVMPLQ